MTVTTKPDIDNYLSRIAEIQETIVTGSIAVKNPKAAPSDPPFWLMHAQGQTTQPEASNVWVVNLSVRFILVRKKGKGALGDYAAEKTLIDDMIDVLWYFTTTADYRNLITATYTTVQAGFVPDSVVISNQERFNNMTSVGECVGSIHTLTWSHRMINFPPVV